MADSDPITLTRDLLDLIRIQRKEVTGLTQKGAALAAGDMSEVWWRQIESGHVKSAQAETLARMCYAINISPEQLRNIGQGGIASLVKRRRALLQPGLGRAPQSDLETYLMATPGLSDKDRVVLVSVAMGLLRAQEHEPSVNIAG
jgi:Helix-turn-helix domain